MRSLPVTGLVPRRRLPSASGLQRAFNCTLSEQLPHVGSTDKHSERGTAAHAFIQHARKVGREAALLATRGDEHSALFEAIPLDELPVGGDQELALAWDYLSDSTRVLDGDGHRDYAAVTATEYPGTFDYVGRDGDEAVVIDWKFGHRWLGPARDAWQLKLGARAASRLMDLDRARVAYFFLRDDGTYGVSWASFDAFDLAGIADDLRALASDLEEEGAAHEGDWCDYCPAFDACPSKLALAREIGAGTALSDIEKRVEEMSPTELGRAYLAIERYDEIAERARKAIRQRAAMQAVDLDAKRTLGTVQWPFTSVNALVAHDEITRLHGLEAADAACPRSATITAIKKLGKPTLAAIEQRGGIYTGSKPQVRVHQKKESK